MHKLYTKYMILNGDFRHKQWFWKKYKRGKWKGYLFRTRRFFLHASTVVWRNSSRLWYVRQTTKNKKKKMCNAQTNSRSIAVAISQQGVFGEWKGRKDEGWYSYYNRSSVWLFAYSCVLVILNCSVFWYGKHHGIVNSNNNNNNNNNNSNNNNNNNSALEKSIVHH